MVIVMERNVISSEELKANKADEAEMQAFMKRLEGDLGMLVHNIILLNHEVLRLQTLKESVDDSAVNGEVDEFMANIVKPVDANREGISNFRYKAEIALSVLAGLDECTKSSIRAIRRFV